MVKHNWKEREGWAGEMLECDICGLAKGGLEFGIIKSLGYMAGKNRHFFEGNDDRFFDPGCKPSIKHLVQKYKDKKDADST